MLSKVKKGDKVALVGFTGIRLSDVEITSSTKKQLKALKKNGDEMIFDRETGMQTNTEEGKERYANKIMTLEEAPTNKPAKKKTPETAKAEEVEDFDEEEEEVEDFDEEEEDEDFDEEVEDWEEI